jgi:formylglycine-generating enzyme
MEWTSDQYEPELYASRSDSQTKDPVVPVTKLYPGVVRGGSYRSEAEELRSTKRLISRPDWKRIDPQIPKSQWWFPEAPFLGLRVVRPLNTPSEAQILAYYDRAPIADY